MEDAPEWLKVPKSECPDIWIRLPRHKWPKSWSSMEDPVVPLERNLYCHPLAGLLWETQFEKVLLQHGWEKVFNCECSFVNRARGLFLSVYVDDIKLARKKQNINPTWKIFMKDFDLGEPTSFLDHVYLGCGQRECQIRKDNVDNYATEKLSETKTTGKLDAKRYLHGPTTWKVMQRNAWKDIANLHIKRLNNYTKLQHHAWMTINLKKKTMSQLESYLRFAHKLLCNVCIWLVWRDLIFYCPWTNLLVRSPNGQKLLTNDWHVWSLTFTTRVNTGNIVMRETQHNNADYDFRKTLILQETPKTRSQHQEVSIEAWLGENSKLGMSLCTSWKRIILICVCGWHQIGWEETKYQSDVNVLNKEVDLVEPTSFLDHVFLGCTQRQCEMSKDIVDNYRNMFGSRISAWGTEKLPWSENMLISSWSYDMEGHAKKCVERNCELANKTTQQLY